MKAAVITRPGGPEVIEIREVETPRAGPDDVLIRVRASGLNRADLHQRKGVYPAPPGAPADITILAERPKLKKFKPAMADILARITATSPSQFNLKAGTNEGCDAIGRGEAIAANAVVLLVAR